jgi:hypothetical protein
MRRAFNREELDIRMAVLPFLTAESDVKYAGRAPPRARCPRPRVAWLGRGGVTGARLRRSSVEFLCTHLLSRVGA